MIKSNTPKIYSLNHRWDIFLRLYELRNFSEVAKNLGITQSAVSKNIQQLENDIGITLFHRHIRPILPTAEGTILKEQLTENIQKFETLIHSLQENNFVRPILRFGCTESTCRTMVPAVLNNFRSRVSKFIQLSGSSDVLIEKLINRDVDVVLVCDSFHEKKHLNRHFAYEEPSVLVMPKSIANRHTCWSVEDLKKCGIPLINSVSSTGAGRLNNRILSQITVKASTIYEVDSDAVMIEMLNAGLGWTITRPSTLLSNTHTDGNFIICQLNQPLEPLRFFVISRNNEYEQEAKEISALCSKVFKLEVLPQCLNMSPLLNQLYDK